MSKKSKITNLRQNTKIDKFLKGNSNSTSTKTSKIKIKINIPTCSGSPSIFKPHPNVQLIQLYPKNPQIRSYQQDIVTHCVCRNTLVCLPTGLGKTHIASIMIANYARWFEEGKILFLAPTRPLVRQQRLSLKWFHELLPCEVFEVNGQIPAKKRQKIYSSQRIFFATPQTIENDLKQNRLNAKQIVLIIFDECHRAVGASSYTQIIKKMDNSQTGYRIIGLSATPGNEYDKIQQVLTNLHIAKMIYKDENDEDVKPYLFNKSINEIVIGLSEIIRECVLILNQFLVPVLGVLLEMKLIQPWILRKQMLGGSFFMLKEQFDKNIPNIEMGDKNMAYLQFSIAQFFLAARNALIDQGYDTFRQYFFKQKSQQIKGKDKDQYQGCKLPKKTMQKIQADNKYQRIHQIFFNSNNSSCIIHPKIDKLKKILQDFFTQKKNKQHKSKIIIFTQLRATAVQIQKCLDNLQCVKSQLFFGQAKSVITEREQDQKGDWSVSSRSIQLGQKKQIEVIERYKRGQINTLISTSIGEEGLDIGEVDGIICYDGGYSPIRQIQRKGRTGRKRQGQVFILLMQGKEATSYKKGIAKHYKMRQLLKKENSKFQYYGFNSSMLEEHTQLPIVFVDNKVSEEKEEKVGKKGKEKEQEWMGYKEEKYEDEEKDEKGSEFDSGQETTILDDEGEKKEYVQLDQIIEKSQSQQQFFKQQYSYTIAQDSNTTTLNQQFFSNDIPQQTSKSEYQPADENHSLPSTTFNYTKQAQTQFNKQSLFSEQDDDDDSWQIFQQYQSKKLIKEEQGEEEMKIVEREKQEESQDGSICSEEALEIIVNLAKMRDGKVYYEDL